MVLIDLDNVERDIKHQSIMDNFRINCGEAGWGGGGGGRGGVG